MKLILSLVMIGCALKSSEGRIQANNRPQEEDTDDLPEFDCSKGCPLKRKDMGPKVCGDDNITYYNKCLAVCQGVNVVKKGACPGDKEDQRPDSFDEDDVVDLDVMDRFKAEKFKLTGKRKFISGDVLEDVDEEVPEEDNYGGKKDKDKKPKKVRMVRLSDDMFEYTAEVDFEDVDLDLTDLEPLGEPDVLENEDELGADGDNRDLLVFGYDSRYELRGTSATRWPNRLNGRTDIGCSGTVIYRDAVLTAGHCVHTGGSGGYWRDYDFSPAQYRTSDNTLVRPYGKYYRRYVTTYSAWVNDRNGSYDIAVARYYPKSGVDIGTRVGYAGLRYSMWDSSYLNRSYNTGYPADKAYPNHEMWKSYCGSVFKQGSNNYRTDHTCDTYGGNSGSSFMDYNGYVHGIHTAHYTNGSGNVGLLLNGAHWTNVLRWSGRT